MQRRIAIAAAAICLTVAGCDSGDGAAAPARTHEDGHAHDHDHPHAHDHDHPHTHDAAGGDHADAGAEAIRHHPITDKGVGPCTCADARLVNGWCRRCGLGYVAGEAIPSPTLYEALDAHGHVFRTASIECTTCLGAIERDAFCDTCRMGFHGNRLYVSKLTHSMAKGEIVEPEGMTCATCRGHAGDAGWCEACGIGVVGNLAFRNEGEFEVAAAEFRRLGEAIRTLDRCEMCAVVLFTGGRCPDCTPRPKVG